MNISDLLLNNTPVSAVPVVYDFEQIVREFCYEFVRIQSALWILAVFFVLGRIITGIWYKQKPGELSKNVFQFFDAVSDWIVLVACLYNLYLVFF